MNETLTSRLYWFLHSFELLFFENYHNSFAFMRSNSAYNNTNIKRMCVFYLLE